jgi:PPOX class probable F420-dependent enzyme
MSFAVRIGKALDKYLWDRMRDPRASQVTSGVTGTFEELKGSKYALVVTFKRNGNAVPTPTWFGLGGDGKVYTHTFADSWKVKRIGGNPRVLVAPCNPRGKPLGPAIEGRACVLPKAEWRRAESVISANYGLGRRLYMTPARSHRDEMTYLEISPAAPVA